MRQGCRDELDDAADFDLFQVPVGASTDFGSGGGFGDEGGFGDDSEGGDDEG